MLNVISIFEIFVYMLLVQYKWVFIFMYIVAHAAYTYYFWMSGAKFPILGLLPFTRGFLYRSLSGMSLVPIVIYCIFSALALYIPNVIIWLIWLSSAFILELKFAQSCIDDKQILFALCPPYKLFRLVKDALALTD